MKESVCTFCSGEHQGCADSLVARANEVAEKLLKACNGHPAAKIPWPHRLLHDAEGIIRELLRLVGPAPPCTDEAPTESHDSAARSVGYEGAREIRPVCVDCSRVATVRRVDEDGRWLDLCADHDRAIDVANNEWMDEAR